MGLLDDLISTIKEAVEEAQTEAKRRAQPPQTSIETDESGAHPYDLLKAQQRMRRAGEDLARQRAADEERARAAAAESRARQRAQPPRAPRRTDLDRTARLRLALHKPTALRDLFLLKEILDPPLVLRRGRRP
jgi:hypothetical protein